MRSKIYSHKPITPINTTHPPSYIEQEDLERKRRELAKIATLKLNIKKVIISLQNKKTIYGNLQNEYDEIKNENAQLQQEKQDLQKIKKELNKIIHSTKSNNIKGENYINTISQMIKQDKLDANSAQREKYEQLKKQNSMLSKCYTEMNLHLQELKHKYNSIQDDNKELLSKLNNDLFSK